MREPFVFEACIEAVIMGERSSARDAGIALLARAARSLIAIAENDAALDVVICERK